MKILRRKYPYQLNGSPLKEGLLASAIVFLILFVLQPFGINEYDGNKFLVSLVFGLATFVCSLSMDSLIARPLQKHARTWRVWHQAMTILVEVLIIGLCNFLLSCVLFHYPAEPIACLEIMYWTLIVGLIYAWLSTGLSYNRHMREQLESLLDKTAIEQEGIMVTIHDYRVRGSDLVIPLNDLLYLEAHKNNVAVYFVKDCQLCRKDIQATLASVLEELVEYHNIFQCHRSFVVNLNNITSAKGNSNGYTLELGGGLATVPVSRSFVPKLKSFIA